MKIISNKKTFDDFLEDYKNQTITIEFKEEYKFIHLKLFRFFYPKSIYGKYNYSIKWDSDFKIIFGKWNSLMNPLKYEDLIKKYNFNENN